VTATVSDMLVARDQFCKLSHASQSLTCS